MKSGNCGNCAHNCCCSCKNPNCSPCRSGRCQYYGVERKYVCFNCKSAIKSKYHYSDTCIHCKGTVYQVSQVLRTPKKNDRGGWILLEKLIRPNTNPNPGSRSAYWKDYGTIGCKQHASGHIRDIIWIPRTNYEYQNWVMYMEEKL
jgi:hypothetical protein